jgi:putative transcriptional regulator
MKYQVKVKIPELLKKHNMSLRKLSELADIRHAALSELSNGKRKNINFGHIERIAKALNITDIREIIDLEITEEKEKSEG